MRPPDRAIRRASLRTEPCWSDVTLECGHETIAPAGAKTQACWSCLSKPGPTEDEQQAARTEAQLRAALRVAVPMWVERFHDEKKTVLELLDVAHQAGSVVAEKGDILEFGSKRQGAAAEAFNALARGMAAALLVSGPFDALGAHWEAA